MYLKLYVKKPKTDIEKKHQCYDSETWHNTKVGKIFSNEEVYTKAWLRLLRK